MSDTVMPQDPDWTNFFWSPVSGAGAVLWAGITVMLGGRGGGGATSVCRLLTRGGLRGGVWMANPRLRDLGESGG